MRDLKVMLEFGATHKGLADCIKLADLSKKAAADYAKVQVFDVERLIMDRSIMYSYNTRSGIKNRNQYEMLKERCMSKEHWAEFFSYCYSIDLPVCASVCEEDYLYFCLDNDVKAIKVSSSDIDYIPLIKAIGSSDCKEVHLDCGNVQYSDLYLILGLLGTDKEVYLHHCPRGYPSTEGVGNIDSLCNLTNDLQGNLFLGYSDHNEHLCTSIIHGAAAVGMGVDVVEKCISLDKRCTDSPEYIISIDELGDIMEYVDSIREASVAVNSKDQRFAINTSNRRGIYAMRDIKKGEIIEDVDVTYMRPNKDGGMTVTDFVGKDLWVADQDISAGMLIISGQIK